MSVYKRGHHRCRECGESIYKGEAVEWVKHKGTKYYVHAKCLKRRPKK